MLADRFDDGGSVLVDVVDHDDAVAKTFGHETLLNDLEGGMLLANNQQALAASDCVANDVDDGLALAGPGRPFD
ncbi:hypothetical protein D3C86_1950790 [compost metagenome]